MKVKMLETRRGSEDGHVVRRFVKGETYDVAEMLAVRFLKNGWAYNVEPEEEEDHLTRFFRSLTVEPYGRPVPTNPETQSAVDCFDELMESSLPAEEKVQTVSLMGNWKEGV